MSLHIGYWGCGAYGGNPVLMIAVQLLAARLAGCRLVPIYGGDRGSGWERVRA